MAATGALADMPDAAIFADTGGEPRAVYDHLARLETLLPFPVHRVSRGNLEAELLAGAAGASNGRPPFFVKNADGSCGMLRRQCTHDYKLLPIHQKTRELAGLRPGERAAPDRLLVEQWIGISCDEAARMSPSKHRYIKNRWPLIEQDMTRAYCARWLGARGFPLPPKSACVFCPYHDDGMWRALRDHDADGWARAVAVDAAVRTMRPEWADAYVHRSLVPLDQADLRTVEEAGQGRLFDDECAGMCGV